LNTDLENSVLEENDISQLLAEKQERLNTLLKEKKVWMQKHALYFYTPQGNQPLFHRCEALIRLAVGSNRSGKTTAGICEDIALCLGFRPWLLPEYLKSKPIEELMEMARKGSLPKECLTHRKTPFKLLIVEDDWDVADEILLTGTAEKPAKLRKFIPPNALVGGSIDKQEKNGMGYICKINFINGSQIVIDTEKSFVNDRGSYEGKSYDGCHYDEPKCRELRVAVKRGLSDSNGLEIFTLTPLAEPWMHDELYSKSGVDPRINAFFFDTQSLVDAGFVSKEGWEAFKDSLTEDEKESRLFGKWTHLRGLVYKEFIPRHVKDGGHLIDPISPEWMYDNATFIVGIDPHPREPLAALFVAGDHKGRIIVWEELFAKELIKDFCNFIKVKLAVKIKAKNGEVNLEEQNVSLYHLDPLAWNEDPIDGKTWAQDFIDNGIPVEKAPKRKEAGILEVRQAFKDNKLFICSNCTRTIFELQHYVWQEWRNPQGRSLKEKAVDKDDHMMELLYRSILLEPTHYPRNERSTPFPDGKRCS
jgi:hypothetical protein